MTESEIVKEFDAGFARMKGAYAAAFEAAKSEHELREANARFTGPSGELTQLMKRMQASAYFEDVTPSGGERITDKATAVTYYKFTITGKVVY